MSESWRTRCRRLATGDWRLATGDWRLATGDWRLATGDWRLATGDWRRAAGGGRRAAKARVIPSERQRVEESPVSRPRTWPPGHSTGRTAIPRFARNDNLAVIAAACSKRQ